MSPLTGLTGAALIDALEAAWKTCPHPKIADLLLQLDPKDFRRGTRTIEDSEIWARELGRRSDPRVSAARAEVLRELPFTSNGSRIFWEIFFGGLENPRFRQLVPEEVFAVRPSQRDWFLDQWTSVADRLTGEVPEEPAGLDALVQAHRKVEDPSEQALLAAVFADPDSDHPRRVYADWLIGRGDPRGTFIQLQLEGEESAAAKLLAGNERSWLGPIEPVVAKKVVYERGFPARLATMFKQPRDVKAHGDHACWATVVEITATRRGQTHEKRLYHEYLGANFRGLRILRGVGSGALHHLLQSDRAWQLEELELTGEDLLFWDLLAQLGPDRLPRLRTLGFSRHQVGPDAPFWQMPIVPQLRHLISNMLDPSWLETARSTSIESIRFRPFSYEFQFTREAGGALSRLTLRGTSQRPAHTNPGISAFAISELTVETSRNLKPTEEQLSSWQEHVGTTPTLAHKSPGRPFGVRPHQVEGRYVTCAGRTATVFDTSTRLPIHSVVEHGVLRTAALSPSGDRLATLSTEDPFHLTVWDLSEGTPTRLSIARAKEVFWLGPDLLAVWPPLTVLNLQTDASWKLGPCDTACALPDGRLAMIAKGALRLRTLGQRSSTKLGPVGFVGGLHVQDDLLYVADRAVVRSWCWRDGKAGASWDFPDHSISALHQGPDCVWAHDRTQDRWFALRTGGPEPLEVPANTLAIHRDGTPVVQS